MNLVRAITLSRNLGLLLPYKFQRVDLASHLPICDMNAVLLFPFQAKTKGSTYSPSKLCRCLQEVKSKRLSCSEAARRYDIPRSTLQSKLEGRRPYEKSKPGPKAILGKYNSTIMLHCICTVSDDNICAYVYI